MTGLRISLFGAFQATDLAGQPVELRARKNRALLAILATAPGRRFARERLATLLWESHGDEQARASLRQALSSLRRDLGPAAAALETDADAAWLVPDRVEVDLVRVRELLETNDLDTARSAAQLVTGPFLDDLELREEAFREWLEQERQRAHSVAARALRRSAFERGATDPESAVADLVRCLELEPHDESTHRELMRTYAAAGRVAEALQHYEQLCRTLEAELSTRPAAETERLAAELRQRPAPVSQADDPPSSSPDAAAAPLQEAASTDDSPGIRHAVVVSGRFDLPGASGHGDELEAVYEAAGRLLEEAEAIVESQGGRFHRRGGTRFLGVFGLERARGSEAERAARSALDLKERQAHQDAGSKSGPRLRCAITAGRVIAGRAQDGSDAVARIAGQPVDLAEHMESCAAAGTVVIDDTARRLLEQRTELVLEPVESLDDARVWRLDSIRQRAEAVHETPFVGRGYELAEIERALEATRNEQCAHVVLLRGEAGIGKTRLLNEAGRRARSMGFEWHASNVLDFGVAEGEDAVATLVRSLLGRQGAERKPDVDALTTEGILEAEQAPFLLDLLDIPQPPRMRAIYSAMDADTRRRGQAAVVARLVSHRCRDRPLLVSFEDIHWADAAARRMFADLARGIVDRPVVMLMTTRIEGDPLDRAWLATARGVRMVTRDLIPLREPDARQLAAGFGGVPEQVVDDCVRRAEGNPLFLLQLLLAAREPAPGEIPATVDNLVQTRLDSLDPDLRRVLQAAAVLGQRFTAEDLEALLDARPDYERLVDSYLVHPDPQGFAFSHALIRDAIHGSMLPTQRRVLHARAAGWFRGRDPVLRAQHLDSAEDRGAPSAYLEAGRQQAGLFRYDRVIELLERGLVLSDDADERSRLLMSKGEALTDAGEMHDAIAVLREAEAAALDRSVRCRILIDIAAAMRIRDQIDEAFTLLDRAEPLAQEASLQEELARLYYLRGALNFPRGRVRECLEWQERACQHAEAAGSREIEALALSGLSDAYYAMGYMLRARESYGRCVQLAEEHGLGRIVVANLSQIGSLKKYSMELESALQDTRRSIELARTVGHHRAELNAHQSTAELLMETGDAEGMLRHVDCTDALISRIEARRFAPRALYYRAKAHELMGEPERAVTLLEHAYHWCRELDTGYVGPTVCAAWALASRDPNLRKRLLDQARELLELGAVFHNTVEYHRDSIEVALDEGDAETVLAHADALEAAMAHEPTPLTDCLVERGRLLACWTEGDRSAETAEGLKRLWQWLEEASCHTLAARVGSALARV